MHVPQLTLCVFRNLSLFQSVLQISENDPGLALLLVHLNANLKAVFNDPRSMFVSTSVREYLFDGVRFCINPQGIAKAICNQINGTDASAYPPFRQRGDSMYIFSADICRSVELFYQTDIQYQGIPGYRYSIGENFINDIGPEHDNECFCVDKLANVIKRKNGCLYAGALDLTTCLGEFLY